MRRGSRRNAQGCCRAKSMPWWYARHLRQSERHQDVDRTADFRVFACPLYAHFVQSTGALRYLLYCRETVRYVSFFFCCSSGSKLMILSLCAASQTALSVPSSPGTTLVWRTISIVEGGEGVVDLNNGVLGRGCVSRPTVRLGESSVVVSTSFRSLSLLRRLFERSSGVEHAEARFLISSAHPFSSTTVLSSSAVFLHLSSSSSPLVSPFSQPLQVPWRLFIVAGCPTAF
jgi:hypothetical protein